MVKRSWDPLWAKPIVSFAASSREAILNLRFNKDVCWVSVADRYASMGGAHTANEVEASLTYLRFT